MAKEFERKLFSSFLYEKDADKRIEYYRALVKSNLDIGDNFTEETFTFVKDYYRAHKKVPNIDVLKGKDVRDEWVAYWRDLQSYSIEMKDTGETFEYILSEIQHKTLQEHSIKNLMQAQGYLQNNDHENYLACLKNSMGEIVKLKAQKGNIVTNRSDIDSRIDNYQKKGLPGGLGIATGVDRIDDAIGGLKKKELMVICGRPGNRKTFLTIKILSNILKSEMKYNVLFFSQEMLLEDLRERLEAIHLDIGYTDLSKGILDDYTRERYFNNLRKWENHQDQEGTVTLIDSVNDTFGVEMGIDDYKPDLVIIDGAYLLKEYTAKSSWEKSMYVVRELKDLCRRKDVPIIITWQTNRESEKSASGTVAGLAYSDSIGHESDYVIGISEKQKNLIYRIQSLKVRKGNYILFDLEFDINRCVFRSMDVSQEEESAKGKKKWSKKRAEEDVEEDFGFME